eukprot:TRINITY_DN4578_c0_g4_i1.p1 TRINITY_DN4578_c0_g4~~TRINITY_DN4578_c0_g4_i1.p1  ORF type:complete len:235 (-),score=65.27 TRINITY_DN4578_c0_g4_i1:375-1079(-)
MNSPQGNSKWVMSFLEPLLDDVGDTQPEGELFWSTDPIAPSASMDPDSSSKDLEANEKCCSKKRTREESSSHGPGSKACREKMRRDRLNDRFMELSSILEPGRPMKSDKATILADAKRVIIQLRTDSQNLKNTNDQLQEAIKELKSEKNELRDEKQKLKSEKERLEQQLKTVTPPSGFLHPSMLHGTSAFNAQSQGAGTKTVAIPGYPGVAMWQWMPPAAVDTSQDHVLRPPVA